ncbi:MAG: guanylate kinase [Deltaproteobacteria bacterium]|nr:MAG: guanylate kinase [Deltaproteobacteria bacterium]
MQAGTLFIISAPSGAGKTTLLGQVMDDLPGLTFSVSHTTRSPRSGEVQGAAYHFVSRDEFEQGIEQGDFLEWAEVHGNLYGTSRMSIEQQLAKGRDLILDIDTQGAGLIRENNSVSGVDIFIAPPSMKELEKRLRGRGTDTEDAVITRLNNAVMEMRQADKYQYLIVNDVLTESVDMLRAVIMAERAKRRKTADGRPINLSFTA